tara:strand:+ start:898 stop:1194 length:297 start_codon:yes stop_codon:yes gene_type:complete
MQRVAIEITEDFVHFKSNGKAFGVRDLKAINKYVSKKIGCKTADVLVRFLQAWDEEELDPIYTKCSDVSERGSRELVRGDTRTGIPTRKRRRRRRKTD